MEETVHIFQSHTLPGTEFVELYNHETDQILCQAEILFGLSNLIVLKAVTADGKIMDPKKLERWLEERAVLPRTYEIDQIVLETLGLEDQAYKFGRMSEACILYAMLKHFRKDIDQIALYPIRDTYISMMDLDPDYGNLYLWKGRTEDDNVSDAP